MSAAKDATSDTMTYRISLYWEKKTPESSV